MHKVKTTVEIDQALDEEFRRLVVERKGFHKGALGEAVEEALILWVESDSSRGQQSTKHVLVHPRKKARE